MTKYRYQLIKGAVSKYHVHLLSIDPPNLAPSEIMKQIKERSDSKVFESFADLKTDIGEDIFYFWLEATFV